MRDYRNDYLKEVGAKELDKEALEQLKQKMEEETIPEIIRKIKRNQQLVAEMRVSPISPAKRKLNVMSYSIARNLV